MHLDLPQLRAACQKNAAITQLLEFAAADRQSAIVTLAWCERRLQRRHRPMDYMVLLGAFQALEAAGFGRLLQPAQRARARFQWAVMPSAVVPALRTPEGEIAPHQVLPQAAKMGVTLPPPPPEGPERAGWERHTLLLRPGEAAELFIPQDLTPREAAWLGGFLLQMVKETPGGAKPVAGDRKPSEKGPAE